MNYLSVIPARSGSKGLLHKNRLTLADKPLIAWTIEQSLKSPSVNRTIVSTDSRQIRALATEYGAEAPFLRPDTLASDTATTESAMLHCLDWLHQHEGYQPDAVLLLQCTSPIRYAGRIEDAIRQFESSDADSLVSVSPFWHFLWEDSTQNNVQGNEQNAHPLYNYQKRPRRQDIPDSEIKYKENGSIYITKTAILRKQQNRLGGQITLFKMTEEEGLDIDSQLDLDQANVIMQHCHDSL